MRTSRRIVIWLFAPLFGLLLLFGAAFALLQSDLGKEFLARTLEARLSGPNHKVSIKGLAGLLPFDLRIDAIRVADANGTLAEAAHFDAVLKVKELFHGQIHFRRLSLGSLTVWRLPASGNTERSPDSLKAPQLKLPPLSVDEFSLHSLDLREPAVPEPLVLSADGSLALSGPSARLLLSATSLSGPETALRCRAAIDGDVLDVDVHYREAAKGPLASLAFKKQRPGNISFSVAGRGPLAAWKGSYALNMETLVESNGTLTVSQDEDTIVNISGSMTHSDGLLPAVLADHLSSRSEYSVGLRLTPDGSPILEHLDLTSGQHSLALSSSIDLSRGLLHGKFVLNTPLTQQMLTETGVYVGSIEPLQGNLDGTFERPVLHLEARASEFQTPPIRSEAATLSLTLARRERYECNGTLALFQWHSPWITAERESIDLSFALSSDDFKTIDLTRAEIHEAGLLASASGLWKIEADTGRLHLRLPGMQGSRLAPLREKGISGNITTTADVLATFPGPELLLAGNGRIVGLGGLPEKLLATFGNNIDLRVKAGLQNGTLHVEELFAEDRARLLAGGAVDFNDSALDMSFELSRLSPEALIAGTGVTLSEPLALNGRVHGPWQSFDLDFDAKADWLTFRNATLESLSLNGRLADLPGTISGTAQLNSVVHGMPVMAEASFFKRPATVELRDLAVKSSGLDVSGRADVDIESGLVSGRVSATAANLATWSRLAGLEVNGSLEARAVFKEASGGQHIELNGRARRLDVDRFKAAILDFDARTTLSARDDESLPPLTGTLTAEELLVADHSLETARLVFSGLPNNGTTFSLSASRSHPSSLDLSSNGSITSRDNGLQLFVETLDGNAGSHVFRLNTPATLTVAPPLMRITPFTLVTDSGSLSLHAALDQSTVDGGAVLDNIDLSLLSGFLPFNLNGSLDGDLTLNGTPAAPVCRGRLEIQNVRAAIIDQMDQVPMDADISLTLNNEQLSVKGSLTGLGEEPGSFDLQLPVRFTLAPVQFALKKGDPVSGSLTSPVSLDMINALFAWPDQIISGTTVTDLKLGGSVLDPSLTGAIAIRDAGYENLRTGTRLTNIQGIIEAAQSGEMLVHGNATDGNSGFVQVRGTIDPTPLDDFSFNIDIAAQQAELVAMPNFRAGSTGTIHAAGNLSSMSLTGDVVLDPSSLTIPKRIPPSVSAVPVEEINVRDQDKTTAAAKQVKYPVLLDLRIDMPARFFVRGRGLDSEWEGRLEVSGSTVSPVVRGNLSVVRGHYSFLGERFQLSEGNLIFTGTTPPAPLLNLTAIHRSKDVRAIVKLTGPVANPTLNLDSEPSMPQDEILAHVLFGRSLSELTPLQTLRLAQAASQLAGMDTGPDIFGQTRELLNVDELELGEGESGGTTVGVGKYIHENVYIKGEKGLTPEDDSVSVEIEITPEISVESEVGGTSESGVHIFWKKDY